MGHVHSKQDNQDSSTVPAIPETNFRRWLLIFQSWSCTKNQVKLNRTSQTGQEIIASWWSWLSMTPKNSTTRESGVRPLSALFSHRRKSDQQCRHAFSGAYMRCHAQIQWKHGIAQGTWCVPQNCFLHNPSLETGDLHETNTWGISPIN